LPKGSGFDKLSQRRTLSLSKGDCFDKLSNRVDFPISL
jgi:hypothetical protein